MQRLSGMLPGNAIRPLHDAGEAREGGMATSKVLTLVRASHAKDVAIGAVETAGEDCRIVVAGMPGAAVAVRGASAAAFFLSERGQEVVHDLGGDSGVRTGKALAAQVLATLGLTADAVLAISEPEWDTAIERGRMPTSLGGSGVQSGVPA